MLPDIFLEIGRKVAGYSQWMKNRAEALSGALAYLRDHFTEILESMTALFVLILEKIILLAILLPIGLLYCLRQGIPLAGGGGTGPMDRQFIFGFGKLKLRVHSEYNLLQLC